MARLRLKLPGNKREIDVMATVTWSDKRVGMGLRFDRVSEDDQKQINDFVDAHFFQSRKI